jgi:hypothetical protein
MTAQARLDLLKGAHSLKAGGIAYKVLLIKPAPAGTYDATLSNVGTPGSGTPSTSNVGTDETSGAGYVPGGFALSNVDPILDGLTACASFATSPSWSVASFSCIAGVISTPDATLGAAGRTLSIHDLGGTQTVSSGVLTLVLPPQDAAFALCKIS